jgi:erythromycin esterase
MGPVRIFNRNSNASCSIKTTAMKQIAKSTLYLVYALSLSSLSIAQDTTEVVTDWLKQKTIPIKYIEPGNGFSDLQAMKEILRDAQVVGLGEATHGTHEFFEIKHRLIEFLVTQMGFTAFAIESSFSDCEPINEYVLTGKGDRASVLTNQNYTAWDTEEFSAMLDWMRKYNQKVPDEKKIHFYGLDILSLQKVGREKARAYFKKYVPEKLTSIDSVFTVLGNEEVNWVSRLNQNALQQIFIPLNDLLTYLTDSKNRLVKSSSLTTWQETYKYLEVMQQSLYHNMTEVPESFKAKNLGRDAFMWENLQYIMERERPNTKFIFWAHNYHVSTNEANETFGSFLRQKLKDRYYAISLDCYDGNFLARERLPDKSYGDLKIDTLYSTLNSINWYLAQVGDPYLFVDLRQASANPVVSKWFETPSRFAGGNWMHRSTNKNSESKTLKGLYDGVLFIQKSTPSRPTRNAVERSKARMGF